MHKNTSVVPSFLLAVLGVTFGLYITFVDLVTTLFALKDVSLERILAGSAISGIGTLMVIVHIFIRKNPELLNAVGGVAIIAMWGVRYVTRQYLLAQRINLELSPIWNAINVTFLICASAFLIYWIIMLRIKRRGDV